MIGTAMGEFGVTKICIKFAAATFVMGCGFMPMALAADAPPVERRSVPAVEDLKKPILWGLECTAADGSGLAFGGCEQEADDGASRTRIKVSGNWKPLTDELRAKNPLQKQYEKTWALRNHLKDGIARARYIYFEGRVADDAQKSLKADVVPALEGVLKDVETLSTELGALKLDAYEAAQAKSGLATLQTVAGKLKTLSGTLTTGVTADLLKELREAQVNLERASEAFDAEPPVRALTAMVFDEKSKLVVLFGGDHFDYLMNDTWTFDPAAKKWMQRHPATAPSPRGNALLKAAGGKVTLTGGYDYTSTTDYVGAHYKEVKDGEWTYDPATDAWSGSGPGEPSGSRVYRKDPYLPESFMQGDAPNAAATDEKQKELPVNTWVLAKPPKLPKQNRDWGSVTIDTDHDMLLFFSGGHVAHGGSDVLQYHFSTNRWELPFPIEFPLGQTYSNTSYPDGYNLNRRPWVTGHTYLSYLYDPTAKKLLFTGHTRHCYEYDPVAADWTGRSVKPAGMNYGGCFFDLNCAFATGGSVCWTKESRFFRYTAAQNLWAELKVTGKAPGASVDSSVSVYDSKRDRLLMIASGYGQKYNGQVFALDLKTLAVSALTPTNMAAVPAAGGFGVDRACYDAENDVVLMGTLLPDASADGVHRTPAYDCASNRWVALKINYPTAGDKKSPQVPMGHSSGVAFDPKRKRVWGVDTNCNIYMLKLDLKSADATEMK